ncbi:DMT family transporter [Nocardiopsis suaedae]|uniref:DMT family transporter n=1 Tax=Nocardiopsis suaedae TaxID=3018444 RepID=A0ABT4TLG8_9ACTN|nr:DMT family transporter [Nocardiopsis suaedae]MDA2805221.1 DMT family transporter [Nocardiopsis suaedae]
MTWAVAVALSGAFSVAAGAAVHDRALLTAPIRGIGQLALLRALLRMPLWWLGTLLTMAGIVAHLWALTQAPLVVIQPIGITGLLFAVVLSAVFRRRRPSPAQVLGSLAVSLALAGLLTTVPHAQGSAPDAMGLTEIAVIAGGAMALCVAVGRTRRGALRAGSFALASGIAYAATSAFGRVIGIAALADPTAAVQPMTAVAVGIGLTGGLIMQNAYRTDHFTLAYATLMLSDPIAATVIGVAYFGERLPTDPAHAAIAAGAAVLGAAGVVTLARASGPQRPARAGQPPRSDDLSATSA